MRTLTRREAIYAAVHKEIMDVRCALYREWSAPAYVPMRDKWDVRLAQSMDRAARAAVEAFEAPSKRGARKAKKR